MHQRASAVISGHQRSSAAIRDHQRSSEGGRQRSSEVIRGHQRSSEASAAIRGIRGISGAPTRSPSSDEIAEMRTSGRRGKRHPLIVRHERHRPAERTQLTKLELQRGHERVGRMQVVRLGTVEDR